MATISLTFWQCSTILEWRLASAVYRNAWGTAALHVLPCVGQKLSSLVGLRHVECVSAQNRCYDICFKPDLLVNNPLWKIQHRTKEISHTNQFITFQPGRDLKQKCRDLLVTSWSRTCLDSVVPSDLIWRCAFLSVWSHTECSGGSESIQFQSRSFWYENYFGAYQSNEKTLGCCWLLSLRLCLVLLDHMELRQKLLKIYLLLILG